MIFEILKVFSDRPTKSWCERKRLMCVNRHWREHDFECFQLRLQPGARQKADEPAVFENASGVTARADASIKKLFCVRCTEGVKIVARQR